MQRTDEERQGAVDLLLAVLVMVIYFVYMLTIAFAPEVFARPIGASKVSIGLASGIAMAVFMVAFCAWYTQRRNQREEEASHDARHR